MVIERCCRWLVQEHQCCCRPGVCQGRGYQTQGTMFNFHADWEPEDWLDVLECAALLGIKGMERIGHTFIAAHIDQMPAKTQQLGPHMIEQICKALRPGVLCRVQHRGDQLGDESGYDSQEVWEYQCNQLGVDQDPPRLGEQQPDWRKICILSEVNRRLLSSADFDSSSADCRRDFLSFVDQCWEVLHEHPPLQAILRMDSCFESILEHFKALQQFHFDFEACLQVTDVPNLMWRAANFLSRQECAVTQIILTGLVTATTHSGSRLNWDERTCEDNDPLVLLESLPGLKPRLKVHSCYLSAQSCTCLLYTSPSPRDS
eukprot:TRINITY_DN1233_c0_g2_i3.p2 TRINITY_DN1233_c0_g2~~TRINITY_DN1233_c0_g2_i3.p2  ORF type:complete len:317 (-),score=62.34 TRINITY_DN1233_c0_g2_i3:126-1076(-)